VGANPPKPRPPRSAGWRGLTDLIRRHAAQPLLPAAPMVARLIADSAGWICFRAGLRTVPVILRGGERGWAELAIENPQRTDLLRWLLRATGIGHFGLSHDEVAPAGKSRSA
jgi:hypothetical protein